MRQPDAAEQAETPIYCLRFVRVGGGGLMRWGWGALGIAKDAGVPSFLYDKISREDIEL